jgi:hypothetical protein
VLVEAPVAVECSAVVDGISVYAKQGEALKLHYSVDSRSTCNVDGKVAPKKAFHVGCVRVSSCD